MTTRAFDGSTFSFGGSAIGQLKSLSYDEDGHDVDVTTLSDGTHVFDACIPSIEIQVGLVGSSVGLARGDTGTVSIVWADGTTTAPAPTFLVSKVSIKGQLDGEIEYSATLVPTHA